MTREERIARHEAAHAAFAITLGVPVKCVGLDAGGGYCVYSDDHSVTDRMLIILGALIEDAEVDADYPEWPLDSEAGPDGQRADRRLLKRLADRIELDERGFRGLLIKALNMSTQPEIQRLITAVTGTMDYRINLGADLIARCVQISEQHR